MRRIAMLVALATMMAGCVLPNFGSMVGPGCAPEFPDGTSKDCAVDLTVEADTEVPGWTCVRAYRENGAVYRLLWDGGNQYGLAFEGHEGFAGEAPMGTVSVGVGAGEALHVSFRGASGFVPLGESGTGGGYMVLRAWTFNVLPLDEAQNGQFILQVASQPWVNGTWHIYDVAFDGAQEYVDATGPSRDHETGKIVAWGISKQYTGLGGGAWINVSRAIGSPSLLFNTDFIVPGVLDCDRPVVLPSAAIDTRYPIRSLH